MIEKKSIDMVFYDFENQNTKLLSELKTEDGILIWQIIKRPLFYKIIHKSQSQSTISKPKTETPNFLYFIQSFIQLLKLSFQRNKTLLCTTDFRRKNFGNETIEPLTDSVIQSEKLNHFLLGIQRRYILKIDPQKLRNKPDFDFNIIYYLKRFTRFLYKPKYIYEIKKISTDLDVFFKHEKIVVKLDLQQTLSEIIQNHYTEKMVFTKLYQLIKPQKIYAVDSLASGMHHAAFTQNIPFFEIQHGFISDYKADYILHPNLKQFRNSLLIPESVFLFGDFYKKILLNRSIWLPTDLQTFHRIDSQKRTSVIRNEQQTFFYPHQWVFYEETMAIIKAFGNSNKKLKIKFHPNEKEQRMDEFLNLCSKYSNIEVVNKEASTYDAVVDVDAVFGFFTTMLLETAAMQIPTITLKLDSQTKKTSIHDYVEDDVLKEIIEDYDFISFLDKITSSEKLNINMTISHKNYLQA